MSNEHSRFFLLFDYILEQLIINGGDIMGLKNISNDATTIKEQLNLLPSDNWSIDNCLLYCNYEGVAIVQSEIILDKYYTYFESLLEEVEISEKYFYAPHMFAADYYGDPALYFIVLYFANMTSIFEFNKKKIKVLPYSHINDVNKVFAKYKKTVETNKKNPPIFKSSDTSTTKTSAKYIK